MTDLETYNTQEDACWPPQLIIANVPTKILVAHEGTESGLGEVEPGDLLATIKERAAPVTVLNAMALKNTCNTPLTFDTVDTLATQFSLSEKASADLQRIHNITTSKTEMMVMWLLEIEKEKDYEDQVVEFRARTTNDGFDDFVSFFSERNVKVRRLNKFVQGRTKAAEYHSATNVDKINKCINDKVDAEMANFAAAFEAALDVGNNETADNVADKPPPSTSSTHDAILATLKTISHRLDKVEKGSDGRCRRGYGRDREDKDASTQAAGDGRKPCVNCGKRHKVPDEKCWT